MVCPNCNEKFKELTLNDQTILHCDNCGGSFFAENGINRISIQAAQELAESKLEEMIGGAIKFCPRDQASLSPVQNESIPQNVTLLHCPTCAGIFAFPDDLLIFKRAQNAKIQYFKLWSEPLPSIKAVLLLFFILSFSVLSYLSFSALKNKDTIPIQAEDFVQNINIFKAGRNVIVSFKTQSPLRSQIIMLDRTEGTKVIKDVAKIPATFHTITLSGLALENEIYFTIAVFDNQGRRTETGKRKLIP